MGYSLNNISLFSTVLAIGIAVDDAIVVLENIARQMAMGYDTHRHHHAMEEITGPILAITLVLRGVHSVRLHQRHHRTLFRQFALTIAASTVISAINALTMTPSPLDLQNEGRGKRPRAQEGSIALVDLRSARAR